MLRGRTVCYAAALSIHVVFALRLFCYTFLDFLRIRTCFTTPYIVSGVSLSEVNCEYKPLESRHSLKRRNLNKN